MLREEVRAHVALEQGNVAEFLAALEAMMAGDSHFKQIQEKLEGQIIAQVDPATVLRVFAEAMDAIVMRPDAYENRTGSGGSSSGGSSKPLTHLLLELLPGAVDRCPGGPSCVKKEATQLLLHCCSSRQARVAPKVAVNFQITDEDLRLNGVLDALKDFVAELLSDSATLSPAVTLLLHFPSLREKFPLQPILNDVVAMGEERLGARYVEGLGIDAQRQLVSTCIAADRLKEASNFVRQWGLQEDFPDVQRQYKVRAIGKLMERQVWDVAVQFAGEERSLQELVLKGMVMEGEVALAEVHRQEWSLPADLLEVDPAVIAAEQARERETYLQLDIPQEAVHFVSDPLEVEVMLTRLIGATSVGLDTEWRCSREPGQSGKGGKEQPVALLQLGNGEEVFLVDMTVLGGNNTLDDCLAQLMASESTAIVGLEIAGDLKKLAASFPEMQAFKAVNRVVELQLVWGNLTTRRMSTEGASGAQSGNVKTKKGGMGLSSLSQLVLGKPLNKAMQVSNWEARPLSARQAAYAALDAHVCVRLLEAMQRDDPGCAEGATTFSWPPQPKRKASGGVKKVNRRRDDSGDDDGDGGGDQGTGGSGRGGGSRAARPSGTLQAPAAAAAASSAVAADCEGKAPMQARSRRHCCGPQEDSGSGGGGSTWPGALGTLQMLLQGSALSVDTGALCPQFPPSEAPLAAALVLLLARGWSRGIMHSCSSSSHATPASSSGRLYRSRRRAPQHLAPGHSSVVAPPTTRQRITAAASIAGCTPAMAALISSNANNKKSWRWASPDIGNNYEYSKCHSRQTVNEKGQQQNQHQLRAAFGHVCSSTGPHHLSWPLFPQPALLPARPWSGLRMNNNSPGTAWVALMSRIHNPVSSSRLVFLQLVTAVPVMAVV